MANIETDKLDLIQPVSAEDARGWFRRKISSRDGFSIEIFRGERHLGSVSKEETLVGDLSKIYENLGVRRDDTIYCVNLGGKLFTLEGTFTTSDGFHPGYKAVFELAVINPAQFIIRYRQQDDPVRIALAALEGELRRYASFRARDRLKSDELSYRLEHTLNAGNNKAIGLDVVRVHDVVILADLHEQKIREVKRAKELERTTVEEGLRTKAIKADFGRTERDKGLRAQLGAQKRADEERRLRGRLDSLARIVIVEEGNRIRDKLSAGHSLQQISQEHPELGMAFPTLPASTSGRYIDRGKRSELTGRASQRPLEDSDTVPLYGQVDVDRVSPRGTSRQKMEAFSLDTLGFTILPTNLTQGQRASASLTGSQAFLVTMVEDGVAEAAGLSIGDIVVGVNDEIVSDVEMLADALKLRDRTGQISLRVLRGKQLISLPLRSVD
jgi:hypothetical protein